MKIKAGIVLGIFPYVAFFVDSLSPGVGGEARLLVIRILKKYEGEQAILEHEKFHVLVFWVSGLLFTAALFFTQYREFAPACWAISPLAYLLIRPYRKWNEVMAYRRQLKFPPANGNVAEYRQRFAEFLSNPERYDLGLSSEEAFKLLG